MSNHNNNQVSLGSSVLILLNGKKVRYEIVDSSDTNPQEYKISSMCPLGKTLIGTKPGEEKKFTIGDTEKTIKILDIS